MEKMEDNIKFSNSIEHLNKKRKIVGIIEVAFSFVVAFLWIAIIWDYEFGGFIWFAAQYAIKVFLTTIVAIGEAYICFGARGIGWIILIPITFVAVSFFKFFMM
jgi:uncharacterized membrane protein (Fun14 family)